jgi:hypothetical protein
LASNKLRWLPLELDSLPATTKIYVRPRVARLASLTARRQLHDNPLPIDVGDRNDNSRALLPKILAATAHLLCTIRSRATEICVALQDLSLPALLTLEILDAAFPNSIRMAAKWDLIVAVKHFHDRRRS